MRVLRLENIDDTMDFLKNKKKRNSLKEVECKLKEWGIDYEIKSPNHIRINNINYYPSTGTCYKDGMNSSIPKKGLKILKEVLLKEKLI
jgi:hypothetical protein